LKSLKHIVAACLLLIFTGTIVVCSIVTTSKDSTFSVCQEENSGEDNDSFEYDSIIYHRDPEIYFIEQSVSKEMAIAAVIGTTCPYTSKVFSPPDLI
jgi:hypothetical protein